jgi:hypothetical protein
MKARYRLLVLVGVAMGLLFLVPDVAAGGWDVLGQHTIKYGDTLYCIGRAYGVDPWAIATQNLIITPNLIRPGVVLDIPDVPATLPSGPTCVRQFGAPAPAPPSACGGCTCRTWHAVVWGNTLTQVALTYGVDRWSIAQCNCIYNLNYIRAGDTLCIP